MGIARLKWASSTRPTNNTRSRRPNFPRPAQTLACGSGPNIARRSPFLPRARWHGTTERDLGFLPTAAPTARARLRRLDLRGDVGIGDARPSGIAAASHTRTSKSGTLTTTRNGCARATAWARKMRCASGAGARRSSTRLARGQRCHVASAAAPRQHRKARTASPRSVRNDQRRAERRGVKRYEMASPAPPVSMSPATSRRG